MSAAPLNELVEDGNLAAKVCAICLAIACMQGGENWIEAFARTVYRFAPDLP